MGLGSSVPEEHKENEEEQDQNEFRLYRSDFDARKKWPIVYSNEYNISFAGLERMHPFDSGKWGKIFEKLKEQGMIAGDDTVVKPVEVNQEELLAVHTERYLNSLRSSTTVAYITEVPPVAILPNSLVQKLLLSKFRKQTGGTILATKLALTGGQKWAINLGGGFHHCHAQEGGGFCAYADITLAIKFARQHLGIQKVMIIDFDAHQGNGHERDFMADNNVYILDMYNRWIYPGDTQAKRAISCRLELDLHTKDDSYLAKIERHVPSSLGDFKPDLIVYNAGTDILIGDALGQLDITPEGVKNRDFLVFSEARRRGIPIVMVTSGGYQRNNAEVIANSILNLNKENLIPGPNVVAQAEADIQESATSVQGEVPALDNSNEMDQASQVTRRSGEGENTARLNQSSAMDGTSPTLMDQSDSPNDISSSTSCGAEPKTLSDKKEE